jgi:hypothetical protein
MRCAIAWGAEAAASFRKKYPILRCVMRGDPHGFLIVTKLSLAKWRAAPYSFPKEEFQERRE